MTMLSSVSFARVATLSALSGVLLSVSLMLPAAAQQKIGIVDKARLYGAFPRLKSAADQIKAEEERLHKLIERSNQDFETAKKAKKPEAELTALHKRLQGQIDEEWKKFQAKALGMEKDLETELDSAIRAEAQAKQMDAVFDKTAVLLGGTDITDGVVKRLVPSAAATDTKQVAK